MPPPPRQHLAATQDLLARFHLLSAYDRYVRPFVLPGDDPAVQQAPHQQQEGGDGAGATVTGTSLDKGKARAREVSGTNAPSEADHADGGDADDDDAPGAKGEKKKKNSYKHLIKGVPGMSIFSSSAILPTLLAPLSNQHLSALRPCLICDHQSIFASLFVPLFDLCTRCHV